MTDFDIVSEFRKDMIENYLQELCESFNGPKKPVDPEPLQKMHREENYSAMVKLVKDNLSLHDLNVILGKVKSGGPKNTSAWINFPSKMPFYGTKEFKKVEVKIFIRKKFMQEWPFEAVVSSLSHEFSHVALNLIGHRLEKVEEAVDLTAMIFGFNEFFQTGVEELYRRIVSCVKGREENLTGYMKRITDRIIHNEKGVIRGYLSLLEVEYANEWIKKRLTAK